MKARTLIPAMLAALIPTAFIAAPTIAQSMRAGAGGVSAAVCRVLGGSACAMGAAGITFPNLGTPYGANGAYARLDSAGTCTDNGGSFPCLKLTGGDAGYVGIAADHWLVMQDGLIDMHITNNATVGALMSANRETADGRSSLGFYLYPTSQGAWLLGTRNAGNTEGSSIAMHGDVAGTDYVVHIGAYGSRDVASADPVMCASTDIEELTATVNPASCFYADGSYRAGIETGAFIGIDTAVTSLASTLCDADVEVSRRYKYSKNAAADITECVCQKIGGVYGFAATTATGDCT